MNYDLIVIGGGAAGLGAARAGARRRARVLLVHDGPLGGECTFTGCIPSKVLIEAAKQGTSYDEAYRRVHATIARVAATEAPPVLRAEGIDVRQGRARFRTRSRIEVDGTPFSAARIIVATGSRPATPPIQGLADVAFLTNETVFDLSSLPRSLVVLGGGAIGCELAQAFARFGVQVVLVEASDRLLSKEEPAASAVVERSLARAGVEIRTGARVARVDEDSGHVVVAFADGTGSVSGQRLLLATGRAAVTAGLELDAIGVSLDDRGNVRTDAHLETSAPGVYAAGDVTGRLPFTHAADEMGRLAAGNALAAGGPLGKLHRSTYNPAATPWVTFTDPEVARVGLTEAQAAAHGARVAYLPLDELDRAIASGETDGFIKLIAGPRRVLRDLGAGQLLGATIVAPRAGEMIAEVALAMHTRMFAGRLAQATHAYPTWSSGVQLAAAQFVMEIGGRTARPARLESLADPNTT